MSVTPHEPRFQHHGQQVETREVWAARLAAEAAARVRAEEAKRFAIAAAARVRVEDAERLAATTRAAVVRPVRVRPWARIRLVPIASFVVIGMLVMLWASVDGDGLPVVAPVVPVAPVSTPARPNVSTEPKLGPVGGATQRVPTVEPSPQGWWCLCYKTVFHADHTACRRTSRECEELRMMIQLRGSSEIRQGTATGCRHVRESHPWDALGRHDAWRESARQQAVQAIGVCALD